MVDAVDALEKFDEDVLARSFVPAVTDAVNRRVRVDHRTLRAPPAQISPAEATASGLSGSVVLATLAVPFDPAGERMAIDTAIETGARLVLVDVRTIPLAPTSLMLHGADGALLPHDDACPEVRATAQRAATLGVQTLLLWVGTRRPARALLEVTAEQSAALLVFAPDRRAIGTRRFRRTARAVRKRAGCLVWVTLDDPAGTAPAELSRSRRAARSGRRGTAAAFPRRSVRTARGRGTGSGRHPNSSG